MCRVIRKCVCIFTVWSVVLLLHGCFLHSVSGPGYAVDIRVSDIIELSSNDVKFIEDIITTEGFSGKRASPSDKWECVHFIKDSPQIQVGYCYDRESRSADAIQGIKNFRLRVSNDWKGQDASLKDEIDRLGDFFYKVLANRFGKDSVTIERRRSGPPF